MQNETVIDLGSGAGFDVFLAAKKVGPNGRAIGVDMNKVGADKAHTLPLNWKGTEQTGLTWPSP